MLYWDLRASVPPDKLAEWDAQMEAPLTTGAPSHEILESMVDTGQAVDLDDAAALLAHQQAIAGMTDPVARGAANAQFAQDRADRLAGHSTP